MKRRLSGLTLLGVIFGVITIIAAVGVLYAAIGATKPVQHQATGVAAAPPPPPPATYAFDLYEADGVTALPQPIQWGNVTVGTPATKDVVVKNTGTGAFSVAVDTAAVPAGWTLTASPVTGLAPGSAATMTLTLNTAVVGVVNFTTNFEATY